MRVLVKTILVQICLPVFSGVFCVNAQQQFPVPGISKSDSLRVAAQLRRANVMAMDREKVDSAYNVYREVLEECERKGYNRGTVKALSGIAGLHFYSRQYDSSIYYLQQARPYAERLPKPYASMLEMQYGNIYTNMGAYKAAMDHFLKTLALADTSDKKLMCHLYENIGGLQLKLHRPEEALYYTLKAEKLALETKNRYVLTIVYLNKGEIYSRPGFSRRNLKKSQYYLEESLKLATKNGWRVLEEGVLLVKADNALSEGDYRAALQFVEAVKQLKSTNKVAAITRRILEARSYIGLQEYGTAEKILQEARADASLHDPYFLVDIYHVMKRLFKDQRDFRSALEYAELAQQVKDSLGEDKVRDSIVQLQFNYEILKKDNQIFKNALYINRQKSIIERKNILTYGVATGAVLLIVIIVVIFKYSRRIQQHRSQEAIWKAKIDGEERERSRLAKELHDNIGSSLFVVKMWLGNISKQEVFLAKNENFQEAIKLLDNSLAEIRNAAHNLMPEILLRYSLDEALLIYCGNMRDVSDVKIEYQFFGTLEEMEDSHKLIVYRIVQELLTNALKHSGASFVLVQLSCHNHILGLTVEDNGSGMTAEEQAVGGGMGLEGIRQSVSFLKGTFCMTTAPGKGTTVYIELPNGPQQTR